MKENGQTNKYTSKQIFLAPNALKNLKIFFYQDCYDFPEDFFLWLFFDVRKIAKTSRRYRELEIP